MRLRREKLHRKIFGLFTPFKKNVRSFALTIVYFRLQVCFFYPTDILSGQKKLVSEIK